MSSHDVKRIRPGEKIAGILGGMGPYATVDFYKQIIDCTPVKKDWEHIRLIIDSNVKIPSRTRAILYNEISPAPAMIKSINMLQAAGADFVAVPCNSAHYFYKEVTEKINIPWLNILEVTARKIHESDFSSALILGGYVTVSRQIHREFTDTAVYLSENENRIVADMIGEIKLRNTLSSASRDVMQKIIRSNPADCVVLACTEMPIIYNQDTIYGKPVINCNLEYAREVVRYALPSELTKVV